MSVATICDIYDLRGISDADFRTLIHLERWVGTEFLAAPVDELADALEVNAAEAVARVKDLCRRGILAPLSYGQRAIGDDPKERAAIIGIFEIRRV